MVEKKTSKELTVIPEACTLKDSYIKVFEDSSVVNYDVMKRGQYPDRILFRTSSGVLYKTEMTEDEFTKLFPKAKKNELIR